MNGFETATNFAAWLGATGAILSLVWAIATWRRTRHHVLVKTTVAYSVFDDGYVGPPMLCLTVINRGQDPITVSGWGVSSVGGNLTMFSPNPLSSSLPTRLETNTSASYYSDVHEYVNHQAKTGLQFKKMRAFANLSTGHKVRAKKGLPKLTNGLKRASHL